ncbi:TNF receptor-associated factor 3-like [Pristis pectinata]|uniref:TNF receptor-associated factor 3-like n=1 Tax=Pristis pectinata TaxID=685728 RepID=UPI00223D4181|nr:TNF receptor-associated factor 3-like [Pristis pectinata]
MVALVSGISPVDPIASSCLLCSACRFLLIKPKQTECGHRYCTACLENLFRTGNEADCYICQKKVLRSKVYLDRAAENDAYATKIHCMAHLGGCDWVGSLRGYLRTHRAQCGFHVLPCANVAFGCEVVGPRKEVSVHEIQECGWRLERCPRCETFCVHKLLEDHLAKCGNQENCPLCGATDLTKAELEQHCDPLLGNCPKAKVACPFKEVGCLEQFQRQDLDDHLRAAQQTHLLQLLSLATSLRAGNADRPKEPPEKAGRALGEPSKVAEGDETPALGRGPDPGLLALAGRADVLERSVSGLNKELDRYAQVIETLQQKCLHYEQVIHTLQKKARASETAGTSGNPSPSAPPISTNGVLVWKIKDFSAQLAAAKAGHRLSFYSPLFASHPFGYRMCCRLYPNGDGNGKGSHISLFLALVRGDYDEVLPWPFRQKVTFMLLDQAGQRHLKESFSPDPLSGSFQKPRSHMNVASGCPTFALHETFQRGPVQYLRNDTIYIKVVVDPMGLQM